MNYARVGDRVEYTLNARHGLGTFIGTGALYKEVPVLHVRKDDGTLVVLLPADGDTMRSLAL